jgi:hypothetical protein
MMAAVATTRLRWEPALAMVNALQAVWVLNFLVAPWQRSCVYTGDQVAAMCCGSLEESLVALNRLLVGQDLVARHATLVG